MSRIRVVAGVPSPSRTRDFHGVGEDMIQATGRRYAHLPSESILGSFVLEYKEDRFKLRRYEETLNVVPSSYPTSCLSFARSSSSRQRTFPCTRSTIKEDGIDIGASAEHQCTNLDKRDTNDAPGTDLCSSTVQLDYSMLEELPGREEEEKADERNALSSTATKYPRCKPDPLTPVLAEVSLSTLADEDTTPRYPLMNRKNLATFSPEDLNYRWRCGLCGVHNLRSKQYWSHCLEEEHRRRAAEAGADATKKSLTPTAPSCTRNYSEACEEQSEQGDIENVNLEREQRRPYVLLDVGATKNALAENNVTLAETSRQQIEEGGAECTKQEHVLIDPLYELEEHSAAPLIEVEWNPPPTNNHGLWSSCLRSMLDGNTKERSRRYSADVWDAVLDKVENGEDEKTHERRQSCPHFISPLKNESVAFSLGSPSFNLDLSGELTVERNDHDDVRRRELVAELAFAWTQNVH